MPNSARLALPYPSLSQVADVPADILALVNSLDSRTVIFSQGTLAARPVSTVGTPGIAGRMYMQTDVTPQQLWFDLGTAWLNIGPIAFSVADGSITTVKLANLAVTAGKIANTTITAAQIANGTITATQIANALKPSAGAGAAVEALRALGSAPGTAAAGDDARFAAIGSGVPTGPATGVLAGTYPAPTLAALAVITSYIADLAVTTAKLNDLAVTTAKLADGNVTLAKIAANAVDATKIIDGAISTAEIAGQAITTALIADANVTLVKMAANSVDSSKIVDLSIVAGDIAAGTITGAKIANLTITTGLLADLAVTSAKLANGSIDGTKLANLAVDTAQLADQAVTAAKINNALRPSQGAAVGTEALRALGTTVGTAAAGDDSRFLGSIVPLGSSFPGSPQDGQLYTWATAQAASDGVLWQMMYNAARARWEFVGGSEWYAVIDAAALYTGSAWANLSGMAFAIPFQGEWVISFGAMVWLPAETDSGGRIGVSISPSASPGSVAPLTADPAHYVEATNVAAGGAVPTVQGVYSVSRTIRVQINTGFTPILQIQARTAGDQTIFSQKWISIRPTRSGA